MAWGAISYPGRSNLLRIKDNLNSYKYVCEVQQSDVVPFLQDNSEVSFSKLIHADMLQRLFEISVKPEA